MNYAGLIYDDSRHYLDHLGPLCALLNWPLITCEPSITTLARRYYPTLEVVEIPFWNLKLPPFVATCDNQPLLQAAFPSQTCKTLWLPHGNSDKGRNGPFFEGIGDIAFVYGQRIVDFMHAKNAFPKVLRIGNFRWRYFLQHQNFYRDALSLPEKGKNILYAPTWDDAENNGSFWKAFPHLANRIPEESRLLVKLHPNTIRKYAAELEALMGRFARKNIFFLPEIPPVYPILIHCDSYIGDMSSIGYDFLKFDRPMYFLNANQKYSLHCCGTAIQAETFSPVSADSFSQIRKTAYDFTFDPDPDWDQLRTQIIHLTAAK